MKKNAQLSDYAYEKYIKPVNEQRKRAKADAIKKWITNNWIALATLLLTLLTLVATIIFGLLQLTK